MIRSGKPLVKVEVKVGRGEEVVRVEEKKKTKQHLSLNRCCCLCSTDVGVWPAAGGACRGRKGGREVKLSRKERDWMAIRPPFRCCRCMLIPGVCGEVLSDCWLPTHVPKTEGAKSDRVEFRILRLLCSGAPQVVL